MHDAKGQQLKVGDKIIIPCVVVGVSAGDFCTLNAQTLAVMPGNGTKNNVSALNTKQVIRANKGDDTTFEEAKDDQGKDIIK